MSNLIQIQNTEHLTALVKSIVPRSFEKTFGGLSTVEVVAGFAFCTVGLTQTELNTGLLKVKETGYCPDPAVFAKWCKGLDGFDNTDAIADSYIGRHGALGNIIRWLESSGKSAISTAEKQAYDETYHLWQNIHSTADNTRAELAFKDAYAQIVAELVTARTPCQVYVLPVAIAHTVPEQTREIADPEVAAFYLNQAIVNAELVH